MAAALGTTVRKAKAPPAPASRGAMRGRAKQPGGGTARFLAAPVARPDGRA